MDSVCELTEVVYGLLKLAIEIAISCNRLIGADFKNEFEYKLIGTY